MSELPRRRRRDTYRLAVPMDADTEQKVRILAALHNTGVTAVVEWLLQLGLQQVKETSGQ